MMNIFINRRVPFGAFFISPSISDEKNHRELLKHDKIVDFFIGMVFAI
jgi:hypothetical protein